MEPDTVICGLCGVGVGSNLQAHLDSEEHQESLNDPVKMRRMELFGYTSTVSAYSLWRKPAPIRKGWLERAALWCFFTAIFVVLWVPKRLVGVKDRTQSKGG